MDRRWNLLYGIPLLLSLALFLVTRDVLPATGGFIAGLGIMWLLRTYLLPPHLHSAVRQFQRGNLEEALDLATRSIETRPGRWESYYLRSIIHFTLSDLGAAAADARRAIELNPEDASGHIALGQALYAQAQFEEAKEAFVEAGRHNKRDAIAHYYAGATLYRLEAYDDVIPRLELAMGLGIDNPQLELLANYYLARALEKAGRDEDAQNRYTKMRESAGALDDLKQDINRADAYPARSHLKHDVAAIETRLRS